MQQWKRILKAQALRCFVTKSFIMVKFGIKSGLSSSKKQVLIVKSVIVTSGRKYNFPYSIFIKHRHSLKVLLLQAAWIKNGIFLK
jgi:hypothetical protein